MLPMMWSQPPWMNIDVTVVQRGCGCARQARSATSVAWRPSAPSVHAGMLPQWKMKTSSSRQPCA